MPNNESVAKNCPEIWNFTDTCYIPFERAKLALSNSIFRFLWKLDIIIKRRLKEKVAVFSQVFSKNFNQPLPKNNLEFRENYQRL
jgi:hypothetical protein